MTKIDGRANSLPNISSEPSEVSSANNAPGQNPQIENHGSMDQWEIPRSVHGCPGCPHPAIGLNTPEAPKMLINSRPAVTMKDQGEK